MHPHPIRFGCEIQAPFDGRTWADTYRMVESLGYATAFFPDHVHEGPGPIAGMAAAAAVTSTMHVGSLVLDCDFRHPAFLARELASIDHLAEGRLEVGIGAGWRSEDYTATGLTMDRPGVRVSRMIEHAAVLRGLWADEPCTFSGAHYEIQDLDGTPKPFTPGGPKLLVGGGAPRVLRFAGASADIVGVNPSIHSGAIDVDAARDGLADRIDEKIGWVREGAGERFDDLEINSWLALVEVTDDAAGFATAMAPGFDTTPDEVLASPLTLIGSLSEMSARLVERRDRWGYSYFVVPGDRAEALAPLVAELTGT